MTYLGIWVARMRRPIIRLVWYRCRHDRVDVTHPFALMGLLLPWIPLPLPFSVPVPVPVPVALAHPLVIDIPFAVMVQFHRRPPTLCWRRRARYWRTRTGFTNRRKRGRRGRERRRMWTSPSTVTIAVTVAMMHLAFQTIAFAFALVVNKGTRTRTQWVRHGGAGLSFPFPLPVSVSVPVPISLAFTVPVYRARGKGRPRQRRRSGRRPGARYRHHPAMGHVIPTITLSFPVWRGRLQT